MHQRGVKKWLVETIGVGVEPEGSEGRRWENETHRQGPSGVG
jgi:hypothetical protein